METNQNADNEPYWKEDYTLSTENIFWWRTNEVNATKSLHIVRHFDNSPEVYRVLTYCELKAIHSYVQTKTDWVDLANNVEFLVKRTEKEGLGKFMYDFLRDDATGKRSTYDGQLSSHLGALFVHSAAWESNNKKKGIKFRANSDDFWNCLSQYYKE